jgi:hypothetical protein
VRCIRFQTCPSHHRCCYLIIHDVSSINLTTPRSRQHNGLLQTHSGEHPPPPPEACWSTVTGITLRRRLACPPSVHKCLDRLHALMPFWAPYRLVVDAVLPRQTVQASLYPWIHIQMPVTLCQSGPFLFLRPGLLPTKWIHGSPCTCHRLSLAPATCHSSRMPLQLAIAIALIAHCHSLSRLLVLVGLALCKAGVFG